MNRPSDSIDRILRHSGSDTDAKLVSEYIAAVEADAKQLATAIRNAVGDNHKPMRTIQQGSALRRHDALSPSLPPEPKPSGMSALTGDLMAKLICDPKSKVVIDTGQSYKTFADLRGKPTFTIDPTAPHVVLSPTEKRSSE